MQNCGIDVTRYAAGSARAASTTKAALAGAPIGAIMASAGWSKETTFTKFYKKMIQRVSGLMDYLAQ